MIKKNKKVTCKVVKCKICRKEGNKIKCIDGVCEQCRKE